MKRTFIFLISALLMNLCYSQPNAFVTNFGVMDLEPSGQFSINAYYDGTYSGAVQSNSQFSLLVHEGKGSSVSVVSSTNGSWSAELVADASTLRSALSDPSIDYDLVLVTQTGDANNLNTILGDPIELAIFNVDIAGVPGDESIDLLDPVGGDVNEMTIANGFGADNKASFDADGNTSDVYVSSGAGNLQPRIGEENVTFAALPITLSSFTAQKIDSRAVLLNWTSSQEINSSHFILQRSEDGENFTDLARIEAAGNSVEEINYDYTDRDFNLKRISNQLYYYRLKQVDLDGYVEFSEIRAVRMDGLGLVDVYFFPNPTRDRLHIDISADVEDNFVTYEINDIQGKLIATDQLDISAQRLHLLNLRDIGMQSGVYMIRLRNKKEILSSQKLVLISR